tara:strand:- start:70 stop:318 length:249 start_codon:yes stop_codon:yes gene_type:complete
MELATILSLMAKLVGMGQLEMVESPEILGETLYQVEVPEIAIRAETMGSLQEKMLKTVAYAVAGNKVMTAERMVQGLQIPMI